MVSIVFVYLRFGGASFSRSKFFVAVPYIHFPTVIVCFFKHKSSLKVIIKKVYHTKQSKLVFYEKTD